MLSTMANLASGRDGVGSLPLALTLSADHHTPVNLRHHNHYHNRVNTYDPIRRLALARLPPPASRPTTNKPFTSFCIRDILGGHVDTIEVPSSKPTSTSTSSNGKATSRSRSSGSGLFRARSCSSTSFSPARVQIQAVSVNGARIVRPWAPSPGSPDTEASSDDGIDNFHNNDLDEEEDEEEEISVDDDEPPLRLRARGGKSGVSPLDALMAMTSKTFEGLEAPDAADARRRDQAALFGKHAPPKKRRKSRTAFTNQQIYELEKRFLYQKYLTPADRDEIAHNLGLTNAQVITWFQNRRAKLKRDLEELKNDVTAARKLPVQKGLMGTMAELQLRKIHNEVLKKAAAAEAAEARAIKNRAMDSISPSSSSEATTPPSPQRPQSVSALGGLSPSPSCHSSNSNLSLVDVVWCKTQSSNNKISYSKVNDVAADRVEQNDDIDEEGQSNGCNSRVREGRESREGNSDTCFLACSPKVKLPSPELKVEKKREQTNDSHDMDTTDDAGHSSPHSPDS